MSSLSNAARLASLTSGEVWVVDSSNSRVGINTATPSTTLDVIGVCKATSFQGDGSGLDNINTSSSTITIGVRTGAAVTFSLTGSSFNVVSRSGSNVPINV